MSTLSFPPDMVQGVVGDMDTLGITESYLVKRQVLLSAAEAAEMILRVDDIIKAPPRLGEWPKVAIHFKIFFPVEDVCPNILIRFDDSCSCELTTLLCCMCYY